MPKEIFSVTSGELDTSTLVYTGACFISGIFIGTDGTNPATVTVYDNTAGSGKKICPPIVVAGATGYGGRNVIPMCKADNGIYVSLSGTGAKVSIEYVTGLNVAKFN